MLSFFFEPLTKVGLCYTHNLHGRDAPHQLLQQSSITVRELTDTLPDELLLIDRETITVPTLQ